MQQALVITFITQDKPGIVDKLSQTVMQHGGNWLESRMSKLAGKFTGIVQVSVATEQQQALTAALEALRNEQFSILVEPLQAGDDKPHRYWLLSIVGLDRPGIVQEFARALALHSLNVAKMHSLIESAPMSAEALFKAEAHIEAPKHVNFETLEDEIESIAEKLDLEWTLSRIDN
jgi:glycine cleavage system regulatory protein